MDLGYKFNFSNFEYRLLNFSSSYQIFKSVTDSRTFSTGPIYVGIREVVSRALYQNTINYLCQGLVLVKRVEVRT